MKDTVCIYSGGMDSFTMVHMAHAAGRLHSCLSFNYGQRHSKELGYAANECARLGVPHHVVDLTGLRPLLKGSALTDSVDVPVGHYADENMKLTVVPNRNMIMLSIAIAHAVANKLGFVWFGAHAGDHTIYPDCRPTFTGIMNAAAQVCDWHAVRVEAPLQYDDKASILRHGMAIGLTASDYARSWTCYKGANKACGVCGSCSERLEAFTEVGWHDFVEYE